MNDILGGDAQENAAIIGSVLRGERSAYRDIVLANAGACIYVSGLADSLAEGVQRAAGAIDSGLAQSKLEQLISRTGEMSYVS